MDDQIQMIGIAVIGAGYWANNMLRAIQDSPNSELLVICDQSESARAQIAQRYPDAYVTESLTDALAFEGVDAVYVATPPASHFEIAAAALQAGKNVLVEKPITTVSQEARQLVELAKTQTKTLMTGHTFLYSPPVLKIKELIDDGTMGDVFYVESQRVNLGKYQDSGVLWDLAPHDLSMMLFWLGEIPTTVSATGRSFRSSGREDVVFVTLEFPSGAVAQLHNSWLSPIKLRRTTISGSQRMVVYDDTAGPEAIKVYDHGVDRGAPETFGEFQLSYRQGDIWIPHLENAEPLKAEWAHFEQCIITGDEPRSTAEQGMWTVRIMEAAERALTSGARESIDMPSLSTPIRQRFGAAEQQPVVKVD